MISPADSAQDAARGDDMTETMQKKLILIDGHSIINRAFYGMPDLTNSKGVHTGAVYGFLNILTCLILLCYHLLSFFQMFVLLEFFPLLMGHKTLVSSIYCL